MQFSESWLRQYVNPSLDSDALGHAMTMAGLEVEEQHSVAPAFTKIVIAQILSAEQHPDAVRLDAPGQLLPGELNDGFYYALFKKNGP